MMTTLIGKTIKSQEIWSNTDPNDDFVNHAFDEPTTTNAITFVFIETTDNITFSQMYVNGECQVESFGPVKLEKKKQYITEFILTKQTHYCYINTEYACR